MNRSGPAIREPRRTTADPRSRMRVPITVLVAVGVVLLTGGFALGRVALSAVAGRMEPVRGAEVVVADDRSAPAETSTGAPAASATSGMVEVPQLVGMRVDEAVVVLRTAGLKVLCIEAGEPVSDESSRIVQAQDPKSGEVLSIESTVSITCPPSSEDATPGGQSAAKQKSKPDTFVVCIDPGHQAHSDVKLEPVGPGSKTEKPRATGGATGVATSVPEYELALQVSMNLKKRLEAAGHTVVMTRTTNDVRLGNSERAKLANRARADLFVRIHGGASTNPADSGIATFYPAKNRWTAAILAPSRTAAKTIEDSVCRVTGAAPRGVRARAGMAGFNWSKVPVVLVETGFLSNPVEDRLMASPQYQDKLSQGLAEGITAYLKSDAR